MVEQSGFELSPPLRLFIEKLSADLATDFLKIKAAVLERASSPFIR
jgi:hypothetical protein